jgi:hypothetical protein
MDANTLTDSSLIQKIGLLQEYDQISQVQVDPVIPTGVPVSMPSPCSQWRMVALIFMVDKLTNYDIFCNTNNESSGSHTDITST